MPNRHIDAGPYEAQLERRLDADDLDRITRETAERIARQAGLFARDTGDSMLDDPVLSDGETWRL